MSTISDHGEKRYSVFLPILLPVFAILLFAGTQLRSTWGVSGQLQAQQITQAESFEQAKKVRQQLRNLATDLQQLADSGNANAAKIVEKLQQRGVTVNPPTASP